MTRQRPLTPGDLDDQQFALYRSITAGPRSKGPQLFSLTNPDGALRGPFNAFLLSPALGDALQTLGAAIRYETHLSDRLREMAILAVAGHWDSEFERSAHEAVGRAVGLTETEISAVSDGKVPPLADPVEAAGARLTRALVRGDVDEDTWSACVPPLTPEAVFELTTLVGYYATLALQLRVFRV